MSQMNNGHFIPYHTIPRLLKFFIFTIFTYPGPATLLTCNHPSLLQHPESCEETFPSHRVLFPALAGTDGSFGRHSKRLHPSLRVDASSQHYQRTARRPLPIGTLKFVGPRWIASSGCRDCHLQKLSEGGSSSIPRRKSVGTHPSFISFNFLLRGDMEVFR